MILNTREELEDYMRNICYNTDIVDNYRIDINPIIVTTNRPEFALDSAEEFSIVKSGEQQYLRRIKIELPLSKDIVAALVNTMRRTFSSGLKSYQIAHTYQNRFSLPGQPKEYVREHDGNLEIRHYVSFDLE